MKSNDEQTLAVITDIRSRVKKAETPRYPTGTVIRFKHKSADGKKLAYAALYASKRWWTTAVSVTPRVNDGRTTVTNRNNVKGIYSNEQFMELLGSEDTSKIEIATGFEAI